MGPALGWRSSTADLVDLADVHKVAVYSQNFAGTSGSASDQFGHGSHVAGIIAGSGKKSSGTGTSTRLKALPME